MIDKQIPNERRQYEYKSVFTYTDNTTDDNDKIMENLHKQIIIDGVYVSGCEFYWREKKLCNNGNLTGYCQENKDCLYKKYKRKEQECEELKHKVELMMDCASCKVDEYKQTLAEIKEICNSVENIENINSLYDAKLSGMYLQAHKILQKISECGVKNE